MVLYQPALNFSSIRVFLPCFSPCRLKLPLNLGRFFYSRYHSPVGKAKPHITVVAFR